MTFFSSFVIGASCAGAVLAMLAFAMGVSKKRG
jgi:hypothetical protein